MHAKCWSGNMKQRDCLEDLGINGSIILKWILNEVGVCGLDHWFRTGASGGLMNTFL
jgi:hypothetical protein